MPATTLKSFSPSSAAPPSPRRRPSIKVRFAPTDTVFDVYRKLTEATDEVRADISLSAPEKLANTLMRFPRVLLRMAMSIFRLMDYFDWLPRTWLDVSPFHGSVTMLDLGSFGVPPADPHLADFGNHALRRFVRRAAQGERGGRHRLRRRAALCRSAHRRDERIADSYYFASALKCLKYFLRNPHLLELAPESVEEDVN